MYAERGLPGRLFFRPFLRPSPLPFVKLGDFFGGGDLDNTGGGEVGTFGTGFGFDFFTDVAFGVLIFSDTTSSFGFF